MIKLVLQKAAITASKCPAAHMGLANLELANIYLEIYLFRSRKRTIYTVYINLQDIIGRILSFAIISTLVLCSSILEPN